ncbi:type II and III secretion system protein family protein [Methylotenera sp. G11]|uniref:type II and III secretion system protein family protein n=1 Tax=Methylotenera sp. G11 TaxID=1506585 RepID=UPI00064918ED|nr:pilus assembly protein N-terminal domain-containing protein [Methylotenera sp. G11]
MATKVLNTFFGIILVMLFSVNHVQAETKAKPANNTRYLKITKGHSYPLRLANDIETLAIGDPNVIQVATLKPNMIIISGQMTGSTSLTIFSADNQNTSYVVQVTNDTTQLKTLLNQIEPNVKVDEIGEVIVLKGTVKTAAALNRVLTIADRFMSSSATPDFSVISDQGGVLAGNTDETEEVNPVRQNLALQILNINSRQNGGQGGNQGSATRGNRGGVAASLNQPLYPNKGNLAQNISRGDVVMVAQGKVMSLIKVESQPKVEIQMQIVAVDRNKTDELGWDWRLTSMIENGGSTTGVSIGSMLGGVSPSIGNGIGGTGNTGVTNVGTSTIAGILSYANPAQGITLGLVNFLKLIEEKGAGATLSEPLITALSGESASFLVGGSLPIPVQMISAGSTTQNPVVSTNVTFVQYGLSLIVRPTVLENGKISIILDQSISEPDYTNAFTLMGAPIPSFRQKTVSTLTESASGETWAVAGLLTEEDSKKFSEVPYFSQIPVLGSLFKKKNNKVSRNELFIVVNARRVDGVNNTTQNFNDSGNLKPTDDNLINNESVNDASTTEESEATLNNKLATAKPEQKKEAINKNKKISAVNDIKKNSLSDVNQKLPLIVNGLPKKTPQQADDAFSPAIEPKSVHTRQINNTSSLPAVDAQIQDSTSKPINEPPNLDDSARLFDGISYLLDTDVELNLFTQTANLPKLRPNNRFPFLKSKKPLTESTQG